MEELNAPKEKSALETGPRDEGIKSNGCKSTTVVKSPTVKKEKGYIFRFRKRFGESKPILWENSIGSAKVQIISGIESPVHRIELKEKYHKRRGTVRI